ncbi:hypothetical protein K435DRAFT_817894 [Dendrothele bispora CBS 962.96]|uniref:Heterokaryon incompatibility domain-containing protein n=1 Tax=Dendrothele bispora (strain CBS 962.96) TaxID=1314807 RepID=A0A4V4HHA5_DENBC|nr:hypothetical protein K435DRAFT_817894 [Dendrothele bispora CBS 962.96]
MPGTFIRWSRPILARRSTIKLVDFHDATDIDTIPPYAILSHRWIEGQEVSFHALKSGYRKILQACFKARVDKIDYIWVDTCCIDKSDHGEVVRNIKSMYAYYENAQVCYAYLSDGRFEDSEWFQRGWTGFLDRDWDCIGDRTQPEISTAISSITGIPRNVLDGNVPVREVDACSRMSWTIGRKTTRPQDQVYCLFGILSVTTDLDYEEDVKTAFSRLQQAVIEAHYG